MESVVDKILEEIDLLSSTSSAYGGISDIVTVGSDAKWGDPGWVVFDEYPFFIVTPVGEQQQNETVGRAGYDVRDLTIQVSFLIDATDYFDVGVTETEGDRIIVKVGQAVRKWFMQMAKRNLNGMAGIRRVTVPSIDYVPEERGEVFAKSALITLIVQKQYQHEP